MRRTARLAVVLFCALGAPWAGTARAGEQITTFRTGKFVPAEVLPQSTTKAVVAEFLDPGAANLGKEASYLVWREILTAISDQKGAGVILARSPSGERLTDMLQADYHEAAVRIAGSQRARMALWGALEEHQGTVSIDTYLTLLDDARGRELRLEWREGDIKLLSAAIPRTRFNFPTVTIPAKELFDRAVVARAQVQVRDRAGGGNVKATLPAGTVMQAYRMSESWFEIKTDTVSGFVPLASVDLPPPRALLAAKEALLSAPTSGAKVVTRIEKTAEYRVTDMRYLPQSGLWYKVAAPGGDGWISAVRARARYSLPAVHFMAGLYRYLVGRWADAEREFSQYVASPGAAADNASLATAYQLLGASRLLLASSQNRMGDQNPWKNAFGEAIRLTPYDPAGYNLRAVASVFAEKSFAVAAPDLARALQQDPANSDARAMVAKTKVLPDQLIKMKWPAFIDDKQASQTLTDLRERYKIE